jgi:hypothetical protein
MSRRPPGFLLDVGVKALLVALCAYGAFSGAEQFDGKAFGWRLALSPVVVVAVPAIWALAGRRRPYPYVADALITGPWVVDALGNVFDLYDNVSWWDDANHFANWGLMCAGIGLLVLRAGQGAAVGAALVLGFGAFAAIVWELGEYVAFIRDSPERVTAYHDTLGDLLLGLLGSIAAAAGVFAAARGRPTPESRTRR